MLIKGGTIHTMTADGTLTGDILVQDGRISVVDEHINVSEDICVLDATGMTILPGLIDVHIHDSPGADDTVLRGPQAQGVTAGLMWPVDEGNCRYITQEEARPSDICTVKLSRYTDAQLHEQFLAMAERGMRIACEITDVHSCRRVLQTVHSTRVKAILANMAGCEEMLEAVALAGCPVIAGVARSRTGSPWAMAAKLDTLGVPVSLTCSYPHAKLRHLPLCAALCIREGMDRQRAIQMITAAPAGLLGLPDKGCIKAGAQADLVIYDGDPLLLATSHVMTIANGKICH